MSKLVLVAGALGVGTSAVGITGVYLANRQGSGSGEDKRDTAQTQSLVFETVEALKNVEDTSKYDCLKDYFSGLNIKTSSSSATEISDSNESSIGTDFFGAASSAHKSCLLVNWRKSTKDSKWSGKFTWLWTFLNGNSGFVSFNVAETSASDDKKLKVTGVFYLLKKESESWTIKHRKEINGSSNDNKKIEDNNLDTNFPKASADLKEGAGGVYWGFLDESKKLSEMCGTGSDCPSEPSTPSAKKLTFTAAATGEKTLVQWCEKMDWWSSLFGLSNWKLQDKLQSFKGSWSLSTS